MVRLGHRHVVGWALVPEGVGPAPRPVDELIQHHDVPGGHLRPQRSRSARSEDRPHAGPAHHVDVRPEVDPVRRVPVVGAVAGQERHPAVGHRPHHQGTGRVAVGRVEVDLLHVVEELVETAPPEHADAGDGLAGRHGQVVVVDPDEGDDDEEPAFPSPDGAAASAFLVESESFLSDGSVVDDDSPLGLPELRESVL